MMKTKDRYKASCWYIKFQLKFYSVTEHVISFITWYSSSECWANSANRISWSTEFPSILVTLILDGTSTGPLSWVSSVFVRRQTSLIQKLCNLHKYFRNILRCICRKFRKMLHFAVKNLNVCFMQILNWIKKIKCILPENGVSKLSECIVTNNKFPVNSAGLIPAHSLMPR